MWDLPGPGLEPVSSALAGIFLATVPPGKPQIFILNIKIEGSFCTRGIEVLHFLSSKVYNKENREGNYKHEYDQLNHSEISKPRSEVYKSTRKMFRIEAGTIFML